MGKNLLIDALRTNDAALGKKATGYFEANASTVSYSTGFPTLDYSLGYKVNVPDEDGNIIESYPSVGITAGSYVLLIGKSGTAKTATAISIASNIVRKFDNGSVIHFDLEQALQYSRIQALSKFSTQEIKDGKYILRKERCSLEDMKASIMQIYREKVANPETYKYKTGKKNEFGEEIEIYEPTVVILDSIATISVKHEGNDKKTIEKMEEVSSQTERMQLTAKIGRFFSELLPYLTEANITLIAINHIKVNPQMGIVKTAADILGLKQDETLPGGKAPQYYANILLRFETAGKSSAFKVEEHGFGGFPLTVEVIKSRVSKSLTKTTLVYDSNRGVDMIRSTVEFLKENGRVGGNKNGYYFLSDEKKEHKFTLVDMISDFRNDRELYMIMKHEAIPLLEPNLSGIKPEEIGVPDEEANFYDL